MLKYLMMSCGFEPFIKEWWHFTLNNEPYPNTYFDFKIQKV
ncbi:MAG: M15 family metallopeptidase [Eubacterium sp.]